MKKIASFIVVTVLLFSITATAQDTRLNGRPAPIIKAQSLADQGIFKANTEFEKDKDYFSQDKRYALRFQADGNLVVYKITPERKAIWNAGTNGVAVKRCVFQGDGNLVLYGYDGKAKWSAFSGLKNLDKSVMSWWPGTGKDLDLQNGFSFGNEILVMQNDGNLVVYSKFSDGKPYPRLASNTYEKN